MYFYRIHIARVVVVLPCSQVDVRHSCCLSPSCVASRIRLSLLHPEHNTAQHNTTCAHNLVFTYDVIKPRRHRLQLS
jgi:hypothetical protein